MGWLGIWVWVRVRVRVRLVELGSWLGSLVRS